jgi:hypothetical protein
MNKTHGTHKQSLGSLVVWAKDERIKESEKEVKEIRVFSEMMKAPEGLTSKAR